MDLQMFFFKKEKQTSFPTGSPALKPGFFISACGHTLPFPFRRLPLSRSSFVGREMAGLHSHRQGQSSGTTGQAYGINRFATFCRTLAGVITSGDNLTVFPFHIRLHAGLLTVFFDCIFLRFSFA
jgi:hypothetical protein